MEESVPDVSLRTTDKVLDDSDSNNTIHTRLGNLIVSILNLQKNFQGRKRIQAVNFQDKFLEIFQMQENSRS